MGEMDENLAMPEEGKLEEVVEENSELDLAVAKKPPTGLTNEVLNDRLFQKACKEEGITLGELREADELAAKIGKARKMHESGRSTLDEFNGKILTLLGAGPEVIEDTLARYSKRHATLVQTILQRMSGLKAEYEEDLPVPPQIVLPGLTAEEVFFSEHFRKACNLFNISLKDVCKFERTKADYARLKRLQSDERISTDEYAAKVEQLLGVPELRSEEVLSNLQKSQLKLIDKLLAATIDIKHKEFEAEKAAEEAKKKQDAYVAELRKQVTQKIAKERQKAEMLISRQRAELEKSLVRRGVEAAVREVEKVDRYLSTPFLRKKAPLDVGLIPKTTAGQERKKLWLIDRTCKAKMKTRFFENNTTSDHAVLQETSRYSELQRPLSALERREIMLQEKEEQIRLKESRKLLVSEMMQKQKEAEIRKKIHHRNFKRIEKENAVKKLQWARESAAERLVNKLNTDDSRIAAFKEVQEQQRRAIAAIQRRAQAEAGLLKAMTHNVECDLEFQPEGVGIDFDKIESHVQARSTKLLKAANCITTPAFEVPVPRTRSEIEAQPESSNTSPVKGKTHLRPSSAPPGKAALDEMCVPSVPPRPASALSRTTRPSTATSRSSRPSTAGRSRLQELPEDGIPDDISDEDDVGSQRFKRIERLRIEQGKNLYHIVREEQELEKERLRMLSAVQPKKVGHLNRLFELERQEASERIMRVAAENEMVLLQEMALAAAAQEVQFEDE